MMKKKDILSMVTQDIVMLIIVALIMAGITACEKTHNGDNIYNSIDGDGSSSDMDVNQGTNYLGGVLESVTFLCPDCKGFGVDLEDAPCDTCDETGLVPSCSDCGVVSNIHSVACSYFVPESE